MGKSFSVVLLALASVSNAVGNVNVYLDAPREGFWGRYVVSDGESKRIGWLTPKPGQTSFSIAVPPAGSVKGIAYAPGCALQTFSIAADAPQTYNFRCDAVSSRQIIGSVTSLAHRFDHTVRVEAKVFLGFDSGTAVEIPLGASAAFDDQNQFRLSIPDLAEGEIRLFVRDQITGQIVDELRPVPENRNWRHTPQSVVAFIFATDSCAHDEFGFSFRSDNAGHCVQ